MTQEQFDAAIEQLEAQGQPITRNAVLRQLGGGSKSHCQAFLAAWRQTQAPQADVAVQVCGGDPEPELSGTPTVPDIGEGNPERDPVTQAEQVLAEAEAHFADAREALLQAKSLLLTTRSLAVDGLLHGSLHQDDELHREALADTDSAKRAYDQSWQQREHARAAVEQATRQYHRTHQEAWVRQHHPALCQALAYWQEKLRVATSDRMHAEAKKNHMHARQAYEQAVLAAPWTANGTGH